MLFDERDESGALPFGIFKISQRINQMSIASDHRNVTLRSRDDRKDLF